MLFNFSTLVLIRHLWQLKTAVFLHRCLICAVPIADAGSPNTPQNYKAADADARSLLCYLLDRKMRKEEGEKES